MCSMCCLPAWFTRLTFKQFSDGLDELLDFPYHRPKDRFFLSSLRSSEMTAIPSAE